MPTDYFKESMGYDFHKILYLKGWPKASMIPRKLVIKDDKEYERVVFGEIYVPGQEDAHGDIMTAEEIKKAAYGFMKNQRTHNIDLMHNNEPTGDYLVETFIARSSDPDGFVEGAWVGATKIESDEVWGKILKGEINCYSLEGLTNLDQRVETVQRVVEAEGDTQENLDELIPPHTHTFKIKFDDENKIIVANTGMSQGHNHIIRSASTTEVRFGHAHRYSFNEVI